MGQEQIVTYEISIERSSTRPGALAWTAISELREQRATVESGYANTVREAHDFAVDAIYRDRRIAARYGYELSPSKGDGVMCEWSVSATLPPEHGGSGEPMEVASGIEFGASSAWRAALAAANAHEHRPKLETIPWVVSVKE